MISRVVLTAALVGASATASAQNGLRKGPWLMDPAAGAITVMVEREVPGPVHVRATEISSGAVGLVGAVIEAHDAAAVTLHEVTLRGLTAGTRYRYEVSGAGLQPVSGSFMSAPVRASPARFVLYGDTRSDRAAHTAIVQAIAREAPDFVVHTGDLVADGRDEELWQEFFEIESPMLRNTVFMPVIGNHELIDEEGVGARNYRRYVRCEPSGPSPEMDYAVTWGATRLVLANAFDDWTAPPTLAWLDQTLGRARGSSPDGFLFVVMHWGMYSSGMHGGNDTLREAGIESMFRRHRVDLLVSGHDHSYERGDFRGLRFIVTGGSGAPLYGRAHRNDYTRFFASEHHYVLGELEGDTITFSSKRRDGSLLERCALKRTGWDCGPDPSAPTGVSTRAQPPAVPRSTSDCACTAGGPRGDRRGLCAVALFASGLCARRRRTTQRPRRGAKPSPRTGTKRAHVRQDA